MNKNFKGLLCIGDPHLASKIPGFRKDDYMEAIFKKLEFALNYAEENQLLPVLLVDLFHLPRDNATRLLTRLMRLFDNRLILGVTGNHDTTEQELQDDDSLSLLAAAGRINLIDQNGPWKGMINNVFVTIGGTSWSDRLPKSFSGTPNSLVVWISHHNICFSDGEDLGVKPQEIPGIHLLINGHIHKPMPSEVHGMTTWMNPGNISRVARSEGVKGFKPSVLKIVPTSQNEWVSEVVEIPHASFDEVFHPMNELYVSSGAEGGSLFIQGLEDLESMRTAGGLGLITFIQNNINLFEKEVADVILHLVKEVCPNEFHE
jgi:DNA repair exonuclease SbcCD nuclease subunit